MKVVCVGHCTFDITIPMTEYPIENIKYRIKNHIECGGGPASNAAYLLAKWGMDTTMVAVIGDDYYGNCIIEEFNKVGVHTDLIEKKKEHRTTSSYIIANMSNGSRTVLSSKDEAIESLSSPVDRYADVILIDGEHPKTALEVLEKNPNAISVLDAGRYNENTKEIKWNMKLFN